MEDGNASILKNGHLRLRRCCYGLMLYNLMDIYIGRSLDIYGEYCEEEARVYRRLLDRGQVVVDAGANIGCHTVLFASTVGPTGRVFAFEPQRVAFQMLCANLACNELWNVEAWPVGLGSSDGRLVAPPISYDSEGNFGDLSLSQDGPGEEVAVTTIDNLGLDACHLIKIDVQGMEREVLLGAAETKKNHRPLLYVENDLREKSKALIGQIFEMDYRLYWHVPRLYNPDNYRGEKRNVFGDTVNVNMLCLPREDGRQIEGFRAVASARDWWQEA